MLETIDYKKYKILIIDDIEVYLASLEVLLEDRFNVFVTTDIVEARSILEREDISVVFSDQKMPQMSGTKFLAEVKEKYPETVRVLITGYTEIKAVIDAINTGAVYKYIKKNVEAEKLLQTIKECIDYYHLKKKRNEIYNLNKEKLQKMSIHEKIKFLRFFGKELYNKFLPTLDLLHLYIVEESILPESFDKAKISKSKKIVSDISNMVNILSEFGNINLAKKNKKICVNEIILGLINFYKSGSEFDTINIELDLCNNLPFLDLDENKIGCVIQELFLNAKESLVNDGKDKIEIKTILSKEHDEEFIKIIIKDNGRGIKQENLDKLFVPFYTNKNQENHLGLGLTLAENILQLYNAGINIESIEGKGTEAEIKFIKN